MSHHWTPDPLDPDDEEWQPGDYACKHCDQRGDCCPICEEQGCVRCEGEGVIPLSQETYERRMEAWRRGEDVWSDAPGGEDQDDI